ncbi:MAG: MBL fold metallo-hydrolase [Clostridiales bacterium]|nr:MBL fold metallo-hydrolase [Clostridiales bacterium]
MNTERDYFGMFSGFDRFEFPEGVKRVTAGAGGEALLILGSRKAALLDCGMAFCAAGLVDNVKRELAGRALDYVLVSHTHYDHIGALPFVKQAWPGAITAGAEHAEKVLKKQGAIKTINSLGENAFRLFGGNGEFHVPCGGFGIDLVVRDGDRISLGDEEVAVIEAKGHTDCSLTFVFEPQGIMFLSESTGVLEGAEEMHISILKDFRDAMASLEKCRDYGARRLVSPHYGIVPERYNSRYWELFLSTAEYYRDFLFELFAQGLTEEEILEKYADAHWDDRRKKEQPKEAFLLNVRNIIKVFRKEWELR